MSYLASGVLQSPGNPYFALANGGGSGITFQTDFNNPNVDYISTGKTTAIVPCNLSTIANHTYLYSGLVEAFVYNIPSTINAQPFGVSVENATGANAGGYLSSQIPMNTTNTVFNKATLQITGFITPDTTTNVVLAVQATDVAGLSTSKAVYVIAGLNLYLADFN